jgi:hypothetical protein
MVEARAPAASRRRRVVSLPKTWVIVMAVGVCLGWLPFARRPLSPDEAGYLIVGGQWTKGSSLYGDQWVDRPPALIALFEAADALGGTVPLRLLGALAAVLTVVLSGVLGHLAAPERRSASLLTAGTAAVCVATPLFGGSVVNGELLGLPFLVGGMAAYLAAAASRSSTRALSLSLLAGVAGALGMLIKQSLLDVFVLALCLAFTNPATRRRLPGLAFGAAAATCVVVTAAWARGTLPAELWDAVFTFRLDAMRELADDSGNARSRMGVMLVALAASGVPLVVAAFLWQGRGQARLMQRARTVPDLRLAASIVLAFELFVAARGGSYWLHYLLGLVPGAVLVAASFAQRRAPVTRGIGVAFALAGVSAVASIGWVALHPIDRPEDRAIGYLEAHAEPGDTAVVVLGAANVIREPDLEASYAYLWSLPARLRDPDLAELDRLLASPGRPTWVVVAYRSLDAWELDFTTAQRELDAAYDQVAEAGKFTIYRRSGP